MKNNPPAFPVGLDAYGEDKTGMTLRDYFAAKAMPIFMAEMDGPDGDNPGGPTWQSHQVAELAYEIADAMLRAREAS